MTPYEVVLSTEGLVTVRMVRAATCPGCSSWVQLLVDAGRLRWRPHTWTNAVGNTYPCTASGQLRKETSAA